eukprot:CAMPEP_0201557858 /NCGR_PEP_ID=MMETSP0173_2-20130828/64298_1 /ASSEMBLY_ACC=CAM_ASM_000268 /TAXON_ID=218659 /ORGANISM="Vexillifera sp., Strain DIVA3 564/2" /LENGTH=268 /DNA_ID=CAMNT_0047970923 /DNA_START=67 /DNA_END=870 /DNA_ORIENTATION=-
MQSGVEGKTKRTKRKRTSSSLSAALLLTKKKRTKKKRKKHHTPLTSTTRKTNSPPPPPPSSTTTPLVNNTLPNVQPSSTLNQQTPLYFRKHQTEVFLDDDTDPILADAAPLPTGYAETSKVRAKPTTNPHSALYQSVTLPATKPLPTPSSHFPPSSSSSSGQHRAFKDARRIDGGVKWTDKTLLEWPENDFRIFVGDLSNEVTQEMLAEKFQHYPSFAKAKVIREKSGKSRGYGFVSLLDPNDFVNALQEMNGKYCGNHPMKLTKSKW